MCNFASTLGIALVALLSIATFIYGDRLWTSVSDRFGGGR